jgi:pyruvate kinase
VDENAGLEALRRELCDVSADMLAADQRFHATWSDVADSHRESARNLLHYLALRRRDLRPVQAQLAALGLSSLGRAEAQACGNVHAVLRVIDRLAHGPNARPQEDRPPVTFSRGRDLLEAHTRALLGPPPQGRDARIMVTMPLEAADDSRIVRDLLASGMDCMRINAASGTAVDWDRMLQHLDRARHETGRPCRVLVDIAGPKLRTGPLEPGPAVVSWQPDRDPYGRIVRPARIWFTPSDGLLPPPGFATATVPVRGEWLARLCVGDTVTLVDARQSTCALTIVERADGGVFGESEQTAYVAPGTTLHLSGGPGASMTATTRSDASVAELPRTPRDIVLAVGDLLVLTRDARPGAPAILGRHHEVLHPAVLSVTLPEIFDDVRPGEAIWLDDGRIGGVIRSVTKDRMEVAITHAGPEGTRLKGDKGINLPQTNLRLPSLTAKDLEDLRFIAERADLVGYSFVRTESDVRELQRELSALGRGGLGIVLKIETEHAFEQLPKLLMAAMRSPSAGIMIARGDLAVESGYERMAEMQEEILWLAEASHLPVIWATQVLENLAKRGVPSRAEITDAAMGERAECVMLNKGPFIVEAVRTLDNILRRMQAHQRKKSAMLRRLALADRFFASSPA